MKACRSGSENKRGRKSTGELLEHLRVAINSLKDPDPVALEANPLSRMRVVAEHAEHLPICFYSRGNALSLVLRAVLRSLAQAVGEKSPRGRLRLMLASGQSSSTVARTLKWRPETIARMKSSWLLPCVLEMLEQLNRQPNGLKSTQINGNIEVFDGPKTRAFTWGQEVFT